MTRSCPRRRSRRVSWPFLFATPLWGRRGLTGLSRQARIARDGCVLGREPRALPDRVDLEGGGTGPGGGSAVAGRGAALRGDQPIEPGDLTFVLVARGPRPARACTRRAGRGPRATRRAG